MHVSAGNALKLRRDLADSPLYGNGQGRPSEPHSDLARAGAALAHGSSPTPAGCAGPESGSGHRAQSTIARRTELRRGGGLVSHRWGSTRSTHRLYPQRGAVLASIDGFPIAKSHTMPTAPSHPAMLAAAMGLARQLVSMGEGSNLRQLVIDHDGGLMLVWPIGPRRVMAVLADTGVDQRQLRNFVQANVRSLADRPSGVLPDPSER